jgi:hypothetical protein
MGCVAAMVGAMVIAAGAAAAQENNSSQASSGSESTGVLHGFEESVQSASEKSSQNQSRTKSYQKGQAHGAGGELAEGIAEGFAEGLVNVAMYVLSEGGASSMERIDPGADASLRRNEGDPLIPFVRYDFGYQRVSANITARINRFEGGYGPVALFLEDYTLSERLPASTLKIKRHMFLYRMSMNRVEIDIGLGKSVIAGMRRTVIDAVPLRVRAMLTENVSVDLMFVGGDGMDDSEVALHWGRQFGSFKVGHRTLHSDGASLSGPFAGMAFYF